LREWLAAPNLTETRLVVVTHRAVDAGSVPVEVTESGVWGLIRVAQSEYPGRIVLLDLDDALERSLDDALPAALSSGRAQLAFRVGRLRIPKLVQSKSAAPVTLETDAPTRPNHSGTVLITGASGALGGLVARQMVAAGRVKRVELLSRRGAQAAGLGTLAAELASLGPVGATVHVTACDAADRDGFSAVIAAIPGHAPLRSVIHAAGALDDGIIESLTPERVEAVMRPKVEGAWNLHELTRDLELDDFVLFSSMAGIWGNAGQGNYAAANTFLDALAAHRRHTTTAGGLPATSLAWGPWRLTPSAATPGGTADHIEDADWRRMARHGLHPLDSAEGLARLDAVLQQPRRTPPLLIPVRLDLGVLRRHSGVGLPPLLSGLVGGASSGRGRVTRRVVSQASGTPEENGLAARLATLAPSARERAVQDLVRAESAQVLGLRGRDAVDAGRSFLELGLTSVTALELRNRLSGVAGLTLPASVIFDHPTPSDLAGYLCANVAPAETAVLVLDGIDQFAGLLTGVDQDSDKRPEIITRLEGLLADFRSRTADNATAYRDLSVASDDEMLDLINRELGI
jgi:NAD(P)-dependent dehydrogenase (short-subunit alcohol dehydrogenase family)